MLTAKRNAAAASSNFVNTKRGVNIFTMIPQNSKHAILFQFKQRLSLIFNSLDFIQEEKKVKFVALKLICKREGNRRNYEMMDTNTILMTLLLWEKPKTIFCLSEMLDLRLIMFLFFIHIPFISLSFFLNPIYFCISCTLLRASLRNWISFFCLCNSTGGMKIN